MASPCSCNLPKAAAVGYCSRCCGGVIIVNVIVKAGHKTVAAATAVGYAGARKFGGNKQFVIGI